MGHYDSAIADYTKAISIEPRESGLLIDQGKILAKVGRDHEAIADFSHAIDIGDKAVAAFRERGLVYKKLGDFAADLTWFTRFEPRDQEVVRAIEEMQTVALSPRQAEPEPSRPPETKKAEPGNSRQEKFNLALKEVEKSWDRPKRFDAVLFTDPKPESSPGSSWRRSNR